MAHDPTALRTVREAAGLRREDLAARAGVSVVTIWRAESGNTSPTLGTLQSIARALGCTMDDLLAREPLDAA